MLRLQGFPDSFIINIPYSQARKVAGNSVSVPVIKSIAGNLVKALQLRVPRVPTPMLFKDL
jgi:DNA (cytosine-5)-methyltransferase 1